MARGTSRVRITFVRAFKADEKGAKQMKDIVAWMAANMKEGETIDRQDLVKRLEEAGAIQTRQGVDRILAYYQEQMKSLGLIKVEPIPGEAKPAKEPKTAGAAKSPAVAKSPATSSKAPSAAAASSPAAQPTGKPASAPPPGSAAAASGTKATAADQSKAGNPIGK